MGKKYYRSTGRWRKCGYDGGADVTAVEIGSGVAAHRLSLVVVVAEPDRTRLSLCPVVCLRSND
jgi:hypothetical protein